MSILADGWSLVNSAGEVISEALGLGDGDDSDGAMGSLRYILVEGDPLVGETGIILPVGRSSPELTGIPVAFIGDMVQCYTCGQIKPIEKDGGPYRVGIFSGDVDISVFDIVNATEEFAYENDVIYCACGKKPLQAVLAPVQQAKDTEDAPTAAMLSGLKRELGEGWSIVQNKVGYYEDKVLEAVHDAITKPVFSSSTTVEIKETIFKADSGLGDRVLIEQTVSYNKPAEYEGYFNSDVTINEEGKFDSAKIEFTPTGTSFGFDTTGKLEVGQKFDRITTVSNIGFTSDPDGMGLEVGVGTEIADGNNMSHGAEGSIRAGGGTAAAMVVVGAGVVAGPAAAAATATAAQVVIVPSALANDKYKE